MSKKLWIHEAKGLFTWRSEPQIGEVPRLGGVTNLFIQSLFFLDCFHMRGGVPHLHVGGLPGQPCWVTCLGWVRFLHVNAEGGVG